jgi:colicin import membrane protein
MKQNMPSTLVAIVLFALTGCHKAEAPATVQNDLAEAQEAAADKEAKANQRAAAAVAAAEQTMAAEAHKAHEKAANAAYDVSITRADGDHKIAAAKCEVLSGDAQTACLDQADAARDLAKAKAEAAKVNQT